MPPEKLSHWDDFIQRISVDLQNSGYSGAGLFIRIRRPSQCMNEEVVIDVQYNHKVFGSKIDELVLFRDGTWRYIPR